MKMLDLFSGRWGWSRAFAARGWECVGVDLTEPPEIPEGCSFLKADVLTLTPEWVKEQGFDFICASSPCEQFSIHDMKMFHANPAYPELGLRLFNHTRMLCEMSQVPYIMENVRAAQRFVGYAAHHAGPYYLWGSAVPPLMPRGIRKGASMGTGSALRGMTREQKNAYRKKFPCLQVGGKSKARAAYTSQWATIPTEVAACVAEYAERLIEVAA